MQKERKKQTQQAEVVKESLYDNPQTLFDFYCI